VKLSIFHSIHKVPAFESGKGEDRSLRLVFDRFVSSGCGFEGTPGGHNDESEDALGGDIHDCVQARFQRGRNHALSFSEDPDNWVKSPENNGHPSDFVVKSTSFFTILVNLGVLQQDSNDVEEDNHSEDEEEPLVLVWGLSTSASETNHQHVKDDSHGDFVRWCTSKSKNVPKHEWGGKNPVDVSAPVDRRESSGNFFDPHFTSSGEHEQVSKSCNSGDGHSENFEELVSSDGLSLHVEVQGGKEHAEESNQDAPVSEVSKIIFHWVRELFHAVDRTQVRSPLWSDGRVQEFFDASFDVMKVRGGDDNSSRFLVVSESVPGDDESLFGLEDIFPRDVSFCECSDGK